MRESERNTQIQRMRDGVGKKKSSVLKKEECERREVMKVNK